MQSLPGVALVVYIRITGFHTRTARRCRGGKPEQRKWRRPALEERECGIASIALEVTSFHSITKSRTAGGGRGGATITPLARLTHAHSRAHTLMHEQRSESGAFPSLFYPQVDHGSWSISLYTGDYAVPTYRRVVDVLRLATVEIRGPRIDVDCSTLRTG